MGYNRHLKDLHEAVTGTRRDLCQAVTGTCEPPQRSRSTRGRQHLLLGSCSRFSGPITVLLQPCRLGTIIITIYRCGTEGKSVTQPHSQWGAGLEPKGSSRCPALTPRFLCRPLWNRDLTQRPRPSPCSVRSSGPAMLILRPAEVSLGARDGLGEVWSHSGYKWMCISSCDDGS